MMLRLFVLVCAIALGAAVAAGPLDRKFIYQIDDTYAPPPVGFVEHKMATPDGETIIVWAHPPRPNRTTIVYFHGNAGTLSMRTQRFKIFTDQGFGIIAMAYRGYSGSSGKPTERRIIQDAERLLDMAETFGANDVGGVALYGESLGAAVVSQIADTDIPYRAAVLEAPFTSVPELAEHLLPKLSFATRFLTDKWNSAEALTHMNDRPLLVLHGTQDPLIPIEMGRAIVDAAATSNKRLYSVTGAGHLDVWQPDAIRVILAFYRKH